MTMEPEIVVSLNGVSKTFRDFWLRPTVVAVDALSLGVRRGEVFGLLGPNGSGKTTTINCLLSLLSFDKGEIEIFGKEMTPVSYDIKKEIGVIMHDEPDTLEFDGKRFLVGHGDGLGHLDRRYDFIRRVFRCRFNQWLFTLVPSRLTFGIAFGWSSHSRKGHIKKNPDVYKYLGDNREGIVIYCRQRLEREHFDYCVFGHRHTPLVKDDCLPGSIYVNVGDWLMHRNYAVYHNGSMQLFDLFPTASTNQPPSD